MIAAGPAAAMLPEILFQSNHLLIINKPAGLPCHRGPSRIGPCVEDFFPLWRRGHDGPWLAHRLDTDTAGCLMIARRKTTLTAIQSGFRSGAVDKTYAAIVRGVPTARDGVISARLLKHQSIQGWHIAVDPGGSPARTLWRVLAVHNGQTLLELTPQTGRTHQLRVHCASIGHPILGDPLYGDPADKTHPVGLCLLARRLALTLGATIITAAAPWPEAMRAAWGDALPHQ